MDEARRRAEEVADEVARWQSRQHIIEILLVYAADAVAQAIQERDALHAHLDKEIDERADQQAEEIRRLIAERNMLRTPENFTEALVADHMREQAEAIARLTTELAGAEATNAVLDEEVARLRAEIKRWKDTLEMELTHSQAWVAQAVRAERERCAKLICRGCAGGWRVTDSGLHTVPRSERADESDWYEPCMVEALRRAPTEPTR